MFFPSHLIISNNYLKQCLKDTFEPLNWSKIYICQNHGWFYTVPIHWKKRTFPKVQIKSPTVFY